MKLTKKQIDFLNKNVKGTWTLNANGTIDVQGNVNIGNLNLLEIPFNFNKVSGNFYCHNNQLTSLKGCPREVGGGFYCNGNPELWDINDAPKCKEFYYHKEIVQKNQLKRLNPDQVPAKDLEKYKEIITELF